MKFDIEIWIPFTKSCFVIYASESRKIESCDDIKHIISANWIDWIKYWRWWFLKKPIICKSFKWFCIKYRYNIFEMYIAPWRLKEWLYININWQHKHKKLHSK